MLAAKGLAHACASYRLNFAIARARYARLPARVQLIQSWRHLTASNTVPQQAFSTTRTQRQLGGDTSTSSQAPPPVPADALSVEANARRARLQFGDVLPREYLNAPELLVYERLYGTPVFVDAKDVQLEDAVVEGEIVEKQLPDGTTVLLRRGDDGELEEMELSEDVENAEGDEEVDSENESTTPEEREARQEQDLQVYHEGIYEQSRLEREDAEAEQEEEEDDDYMRAHPLTKAGRFRSSPSTIFLPKESLVDGTAALLTRPNHKHLKETASRIFGGQGLPWSASVPPAHAGIAQKSIPLDPSQTEMGNIEADAYMAAVQPGAYAAVMSVLVEVRRRLGSSWLEHLLQTKKGGTVLDAGSGGAGVLAWHEVLKADWQRLHEESGRTSQVEMPLGKATVLAASDTLRNRASKLLENTTFIPRLPENVAAEEESNEQQPRKLYDVIIAPHTLWPIRQEYLRKDQVEKYWSLLNPRGGILILIEKGLPRGFEVIASARAYLLHKHIASPDSTTYEASVDSQVSKSSESSRFTIKETGMIIAPCTNHSTCPMYPSPGISPGRKDFCYFNQRYIRPPYLQRILDATDKNHEDIQYSYIAVQRGRDQRLAECDILHEGFAQNEDTTLAAFAGHEWKTASDTDPAMCPPDNVGPTPLLQTAQDVNPLTLPRLILPALKRQGHIILDLCTPSGTLERWTVPRSFSKQAFRDARKARWGDLWALGAKTRTVRKVRLGRPGEEFDARGKKKKKGKVVVEVGESDNDVGVRMQGGNSGKGEARYNVDRKIRGSGGRKGRKRSLESDMEREM